MAIAHETDAIRPDLLRFLVKSTIEQHMPPDQLAILLAAEESERNVLRAFALDMEAAQ